MSPQEGFSVDIADQDGFQDELRNQDSSNPIANAIPVATLLLLLYVFTPSLGKALLPPQEGRFDIADQDEFQDELRNQESSNPIAMAIPVATLLLLIFLFPSYLGKTLVSPQEGRF